MTLSANVDYAVECYSDVYWLLEVLLRLTLQYYTYCPNSAFVFCMVLRIAIIFHCITKWVVFTTQSLLLRDTNCIFKYQLRYSDVNTLKICRRPSGTGASFSSSISVFPCRYHHTGAPHSLCCSYQKDKRAKLRNLPNSNVLLVNGGAMDTAWICY